MIRFSRAILAFNLVLISFLLCQQPVIAQDSIKDLFEQGYQAFAEKRYQEAVNYFEDVVDQNNSFAAAYHALGLVYQEISPDPLYPLWYFETALEIDPDFMPACEVLCRTYHQLEQFDEAERICLKVLEMNPNMMSAHLALAWVYLRGKSDPSQAIYYFEKIVEHLKIPVVYFGLGMAYVLTGEHAQTVDMITKLRIAGSEDFALHLESMLRDQSDPAQLIPSKFINPVPAQARQQQSTPVPAQPQYDNKQYVPVPIVMKPKITGSPTIHIRGKVKPPMIERISGHSIPNVHGGQSGKHPGSLSDN